ILAALVTAALAPVPAFAQDASTSPTRTMPWDSTVVVGWLAGHPSEPPQTGYRDDWFNAAQAGLVVGRHVTTHLKVEIELTTTTEGERFVEHFVNLPQVPYPVPFGSSEYSRVSELATALSYQFFDNQWVHPFVQVGAAVDLDRARSRTWAQSFFTGTSRQPANEVTVARDSESDTTQVNPRVLLAGGAKFYVNRRAFVRTDARLAAGQGGQHLSFRIGFGFDF